MKRLLIAFLCIALLGCFTVTVFANTENVIYISNQNGNNKKNDGRSDVAPKATLAGATTTGVHAMLTNGGTVVVCGAFKVQGHAFDYDGKVTITGNYGGKDYKDTNHFDPKSGVLTIAKGTTLVVDCDFVLDDVLLYPEAGNTKILVKEGGKLTITESVTVVRDTLIIEVEKGGSADINSGTYRGITGEGNIVLGDNVKLVDLGDNIIFLSNQNGNNEKNDGRSDATPKATLAGATTTGVHAMLKDGGTVVACGSFRVAGHDFNYGGRVTITGSYGGKDYKNAKPSNDPQGGVLRLAKAMTLHVSCDFVLDDLLIFPEVGYTRILVNEGGKLTITESVQTMRNTLVIEVAKGGSAIIKGGSYMAIVGEGDITVGPGATLSPPLINTKQPAVGISGDRVVYISNEEGDNNNFDGLSDATPKKTFAAGNKHGANAMLAQGGTLVVCGTVELQGYEFNSVGQITVTANYGGKDYKNQYPANKPSKGVFKIQKNNSMSVASDVIMDDIIFFQVGTSNKIYVKNFATFVITDTVQFLNERIGAVNNYTLITTKGTTIIMPEAIRHMFTLEGEGEIITYIGAFYADDKESISQEVFQPDPTTNSEQSEQKEDEPLDGEIISGDAVIFLSNEKGDNSFDGLSADKPKATLADYSKDGAHAKLKYGGELILCGNLLISGDYTVDCKDSLTVTAVYGENDYKNFTNVKNPDCGALKIAAGSQLKVKSDLTLDNLILFQMGESNTVTVSGATLTIKETAIILNRLGTTPRIKLIVEEGAVAVIPQNAISFFAIEGGGDVIIKGSAT